MHFFFLGDDHLAKDKKIAELKKKFVPSTDALRFDCDILYAQNLSADTLKKALVALPAISKKRLIIIRDCHFLSVQNRELLINFLSAPGAHAVVIGEASRLGDKDDFIEKIKRHAKVEVCQGARKGDLFDLTRAIENRQPGEALSRLNELLVEGTHPLQVMGGLVWFWGKLRRRLPRALFHQGLGVLEEADFQIKRSQLTPQQALEVLVVKLCVKLSGAENS